MKVQLEYGRRGLTVELPDGVTTVIEPEQAAGLADEREAFIRSLRAPIGSPPLRELVRAGDSVAVVFCDITRPAPNERIIPWLLGELSFHARDKVTLINATGMHRANTPDEFARMLTREVVEKYRIINHSATDSASLVRLGTDSFGSEVYVNAEYCAADVKILTGFIEPHFFAGFSGGPKLVLPGIAGAQTILHNHGARMIADPNATWGITAANPIWEEIREVALMTAPSFIANVTVNRRRQITGVFAGDMDSAHQRGVEFARRTAMRRVANPFDIVITTNSGYPLDLNLYQTVKGMSAARGIVKQGGAIIAVSECSEGIPEHGNYKAILHGASSTREMLRMIETPGYAEYDQWEAQVQAMIQQWADVYLYSTLPAEEVRKAHITPITDIEETVGGLLREYGPGATIAVLPDGPQTIPYVDGAT